MMLEYLRITAPNGDTYDLDLTMCRAGQVENVYQFYLAHYSEAEYEDQMYTMFIAGEDREKEFNQTMWAELLASVAPYEERVRMNAIELLDIGDAWGFDTERVMKAA